SRTQTTFGGAPYITLKRWKSSSCVTSSASRWGSPRTRRQERSRPDSKPQRLKILCLPLLDRAQSPEGWPIVALGRTMRGTVQKAIAHVGQVRSSRTSAAARLERGETFDPAPREPVSPSICQVFVKSEADRAGDEGNDYVRASNTNATDI